MFLLSVRLVGQYNKYSFNTKRLVAFLHWIPNDYQ
jgi:hypothetical protein